MASTMSRSSKAWAARPSASPIPNDIQAAFAKADELMAEFQVPVVVEIILERVTNIAMGTEIDNINEFEEILDLPEQPPHRVLV